MSGLTRESIAIGVIAAAATHISAVAVFAIEAGSISSTFLFGIE